MKPRNSMFALLAPLTLAALMTGGCDRSREATPASTTETPPVATATPPPDTAAADEARAAELAAKEQELEEREYALKQKELEQELARREQEAAAEAAAATAAAKAAKASAAKKTPVKETPAAAPSPPPPAPPSPIVVPAGTQLAIELTSDVSTKTAAVGNRVQGRLTSDVVVDGRRAAQAGASVSGVVTQVVSGSSKIGGTPTLGLAFDSLVVANGENVPISARLVQQGKSETGKDTAKIVGGAAAGAIIGHQIDHKKGSVIGGIIGGAAGTAAAQKTGSEVVLPAGTVVSVATETSFQVDVR
jgi:hypothetical protein